MERLVQLLAWDPVPLRSQAQARSIPAVLFRCLSIKMRQYLITRETREASGITKVVIALCAAAATQETDSQPRGIIQSGPT